MEKRESEKRRCKNCGMLATYFRSRTNDRKCKSCGFASKVKEVKSV